MGVRYAVVGAGLVGGSIALRLHQQGFEVTVVDTDDQTCKAARAAGMTVGSMRAVRDADVVLFAVPTDAIAGAVRAAAEHLRPGAVVTEVASVKNQVVDAFAELTGCRVVYAHPMAGSANAGFKSANPSLFDGCSWIICAEEGAPGYSEVEALARSCGAGRIVHLRLEEHDRIVAAVSHTVQLVATAMAAGVQELRASAETDPLSVAGTGWRDTTRLAASPAEMWIPILAANADEVVPTVRRVASILVEIAETLEAGQAERLLQIFQAANAARSDWEKMRS